ncbi:ABC transporter substrate-binding protein [Alphaproteobacteria bacterium GH1-50]|uniref:ABC transporter substrate-binding protein n=1 Tax=Kangsaoukella pontilimi TaxID=2691042 RepID=A0A7C9IGN3_9RHOB|nr:ABC transporter substrate-binding protein [Kangsaoukella pontilimi]MXQ08464.1 ABC transporter substrate-binding protein [Kangsaoukella pontilimi]
MFHRAIAVAAGMLAATVASAQTEVPFALDWKFEGPSAAYFAAIDNGHFADEGLSVTIEAGSGSVQTIPKIATGAFPIGFGDINSVIKFLDQNPGAPVTAVMMVYDKPPFAIVGRKSLGVSEPKDLEGKVLGAPPPDGAWAQFPVFAKETGIDVSAVTVEPVGFPTREPMLAEGNVAAITGFSFSSVVNLKRLGVADDDISNILMADHGLQLYGNAILVNTDWAAENGDTVRAFLRAVAKGWQDVIDNPEAGIESLVERNPAADKALEQERLQMAIDQNVVTDWVKANGMGGIDPARMETAISQLGETYDYQNTPDASLYFTDAYLPEGGFTLN